MKTALLPLACLAAFSVNASAAIIVPGADGSDGPLNITENTVIDLGLAPTGVWDAPATGAGIYDPTKWAVVFKYASVNVAAGATLTFKNNASRAPVVWLVSGDVTIDGTVSLNGQNGVEAPNLAEPGPGGFRGGVKNYSAQITVGSGFGMGGGTNHVAYSGHSVNGGGGSYGSIGAIGQPSYGNPSLIPLIGGSGGGGGFNTYNSNSGSGAAGGGALLLASLGNVIVNGNISANGGSGLDVWSAAGGSGSGGGIRIIADVFSGSGLIQAVGGSTTSSGGNGRIRIERVTNSSTMVPTPDPSVVDLAVNSTALLWPPSGAPEVKVISVGGTNAPADPKAGFGTIGADVALPSASTTTVIVETTNVEAASVVKIRATPRSNASFSEVDATLESTVSTIPLVIRWTATLPVGTGYNAVQARVIRP
jgi:hypothetical protein